MKESSVFLLSPSSINFGINCFGCFLLFHPSFLLPSTSPRFLPPPTSPLPPLFHLPSLFPSLYLPFLLPFPPPPLPSSALPSPLPSLSPPPPSSPSFLPSPTLPPLLLLLLFLIGTLSHMFSRGSMAPYGRRFSSSAEHAGRLHLGQGYVPTCFSDTCSGSDPDISCWRGDGGSRWLEDMGLRCALA